MIPRAIAERMEKEDLIEYFERTKNLHQKVYWMYDYQNKIIRSLQDTVEDMSHLMEVQGQYKECLAIMSKFDSEMAQKYAKQE